MPFPSTFCLSISGAEPVELVLSGTCLEHGILLALAPNDRKLHTGLGAHFPSLMPANLGIALRLEPGWAGGLLVGTVSGLNLGSDLLEVLSAFCFRVDSDINAYFTELSCANGSAGYLGEVGAHHKCEGHSVESLEFSAFREQHGSTYGVTSFANFSVSIFEVHKLR